MSLRPPSLVPGGNDAHERWQQPAPLDPRTARGDQDRSLAEVDTRRVPVARAVATSDETLAELQTQPLVAAGRDARWLADLDTLRTPAQRSAVRPRTRRMSLLRVGVVLGLMLLGVRAGLASAAFMSPGGDILGWSQLPVARCIICGAPPQVAREHQLTATEYAAYLVRQMQLSDELGQLMIVQFHGTDVSPDTVQMIDTQGVGGVLFFGPNIDSADQVRGLNARLQKLAPLPLFTSVDQEGGPVNRFRSLVGPLPAAATLPDAAAARVRGVQDATYLHDYGFNLNLAPVADVGTTNPQLFDRTFGSTPDRVALMAGAYLDGLQASGVVSGCVKHFPGLGATSTDPHLGMPVLDRSRADWERIDLAPYRTLIGQGHVRVIMVTHERIPAVDPDLPTSLSPIVVDQTLRGELGYDGVVITDDLHMRALTAQWPFPDASVLAIKAGADIVTAPDSPQEVQQTKDALAQAITSGTLTRERIDTSVRRILTLKIQMGLIPLPQHTSTRQHRFPQSGGVIPAGGVAARPRQSA